MRKNPVLSIGLALGGFLAGGASAQGPDIAFGPWIGLSVNNVGGQPCSPQDCTTYAFNLASSPVSTIDVHVFGDSGQPFVLGMAPTATLCAPLPGITNSLMLSGPLSVLAAGTMPPTSGPTICGGPSPYPPGLFALTIPLPPGFLCPPGFEVDLQALVWNNLSFALTATIQVIC